MNKKVIDTTEKWFKEAKPETAKIISPNSIFIDGVEYKADNKHVFLDLKPREKEVLEKFVYTFGGVLIYHPRIVYPENIMTPDCIYNGIKYDLKQPGLDNPGVNKDNILFGIIYKKKKQAKRFIIDITRTGLNKKEAIYQAYGLFFREKTMYVEEVILYNGDFFKVFEKA